MKKAANWILMMGLISGAAFGQIATDNAANYVSFGDTSNAGSGFLAWSVTSNDNGSTVFAGSFLGNSTDGAGDINTAGSSFGLYANPGVAFVNADRGFSTALTVGDVFSFDMALNFDNGNKGVSLFAGSQGEVFNFNVGSGGSVSSSNATINPGAGAGYDYGGSDAVLNLAFTILSGSQMGYSVSRSSSQGNQGVLFSGSVSGLTDSVTGFRFYVSGTDAGGAPQNNLYFNNLEVIPEPGTALLLVGGLGVLAWMRRRKG